MSGYQARTGLGRWILGQGGAKAAGAAMPMSRNDLARTVTSDELTGVLACAGEENIVLVGDHYTNCENAINLLRQKPEYLAMVEEVLDACGAWR